MFYVIIALLFLVTLFAAIRLLKSLVKGCFMVFFVFILVVLAVILVRSTKDPIRLFGVYELYDFKLERVSKE